MQDIIETLRGTLDKTFSTNLRSYLRNHVGVTDFMLISDYCIDDEDKPNDVIAFTLAPIHAALPQSMAGLDRWIPKDIKKTRTVTEGISKALNDDRFFHVAFMLDDISGFLHSKVADRRTVLLQSMPMIIKMLEEWRENQPEGRRKFEAQIKRFKQVNKELERPTANVKLFCLMTLVSTLAAVLAFYLSKESTCKSITWFADRDKIHDAFSKLYMDIFEVTHWGLCFQELPEGKIPKIGFAVDEAPVRGMWFDTLIRLPDFIAGTVASWDMETNLTSRDKHARVLEQVVADNLHCNLVKVEIRRDGWQFGIRPLGRAPSADSNFEAAESQTPVGT
ncbi:hypothetical protein [Caballeronia cordobensis]|uniref:hypothetical protein n=1 Tax=Caballeronia cordobensis TaxID=1353886 RepID=UPI00045F009D|nr:putative membrane protein [Burkholderia sp. RPE67]